MNSTPPRTRAGQPFGFLPSPPPLPRIAARAMCCCALAQRAEIEPAADGEPEVLEGTNELIDLSLEWLERQGMAAELSVAEREFLAARAGTLDAAARERHAAAGEAAATLAWALRCAPLPGFDVDADAAEVAGALGWLSEGGATLGTRALLREREQVGTYLDAISAVHWRLRERTRPDAPAGAADTPGDDDAGPAADANPDADPRAQATGEPGATTIGGIVSMQRWQADRYTWPDGVTPLALAADGDMALGGRSLAAATPNELYAALRRVRERHRATLWLLGQQRDWDEILLNL